MLNKSYNYNPTPPRVWSRVQNPCTYTVPDSNYSEAFIPLTNQIVTQSEANNELKMIYKGNVLQYKGNSARLTKSQKYSQLARCAGPNRTKVFATQTQTYTNPNTTGLLRVGYETYSYPNQIVGAPNNISGPFAYNIPNPNDCSGSSVQDGGTLVCGTYANPCSNQIYKQGISTATICNESAASNVPGSEILCWNKKVQTWFPKTRYFMNNSTDKWPVNYKGFVSAIKSSPPILTANLSGSCGNTTIMLSWNIQNNNCLPITGYNIFINNKLFAILPSNVYTYSLNLPDGTYEVYITSISGSNESEPSNTIGLLIINDTETIIISYSNINSTHYNANGYTGVIVETTFTSTNPGNGEASLITCKILTNVSVLIVGGGGGGGGGYSNIFTQTQSQFTAGAGGGGGGINYITGLTPPTNTPIYFKVGSGGKGGPANINPSTTGQGSGGVSGLLSSLYITSTNTTFTSNGGMKGAGAGSASAGGGTGGSATVINGIPSIQGYGGGGGGGAYSIDTGNTATRQKGLGGTGYTTIGNDGTNGSSTSSGNGGSSTTYLFSLPFLGSSILVGGGGGGGGSSEGGRAGNGTGGQGGGDTFFEYKGLSASNYGGGGGGGSLFFGPSLDKFLNSGGNGGNGVIIIWWQN